MSAIPPFTIQPDGPQKWVVVDSRMNFVGVACDEAQAAATASRLLCEFKNARKIAPERPRKNETVEEALAALRETNRDLAWRIEKAVNRERSEMRRILDGFVRVAHHCHECARFHTERCAKRGDEPDPFHVACEFFATVPHRLTAEEASLCEVQALEINRLRQRVFQLESEWRR